MYLPYSGSWYSILGYGFNLLLERRLRFYLSCHNTAVCLPPSRELIGLLSPHLSGMCVYRCHNTLDGKPCSATWPSQVKLYSWGHIFSLFHTSWDKVSEAAAPTPCVVPDSLKTSLMHTEDTRGSSLLFPPPQLFRPPTFPSHRSSQLSYSTACLYISAILATQYVDRGNVQCLLALDAGRNPLGLNHSAGILLNLYPILPRRSSE